MSRLCQFTGCGDIINSWISRCHTHLYWLFIETGDIDEIIIIRWASVQQSKTKFGSSMMWDCSSKPIWSWLQYPFWVKRSFPMRYLWLIIYRWLNCHVIRAVGRSQRKGVQWIWRVKYSDNFSQLIYIYDGRSTDWKTFKFFQLQKGGWARTHQALPGYGPGYGLSFAGPLRGERGGPGVVENKNKLACKAWGKICG